MIIGIDHVQITVPASAVADARAFYCGLLGLREVEKPAALRERGGFWLQVGDRQVHVGTEEGVTALQMAATSRAACIGLRRLRSRWPAALQGNDTPLAGPTVSFQTWLQRPPQRFRYAGRMLRTKISWRFASSSSRWPRSIIASISGSIRPT